MGVEKWSGAGGVEFTDFRYRKNPKAATGCCSMNMLGVQKII